MPAVKGQWTSEENYSLLFQMVQQLMGEGKNPVKFDKINIPGRTPRASKEHYAQLKNEVQNLNIQQQGAASTPQARTPRGSAVKKVKAEEKSTTKMATPSKRKTGDDSGMMDTTPSNPKRRKSPVKKEVVKEEDVEAEDSEDMPVLHDSSGGDAESDSAESYHSYDYYT
ncbi:hypothetical protein ONS95_001339 [Cadophora gregata]|uniref:uncharacterized protein n=1 Tax=Cadophora gregata TaxID=51156 RepID=UPI0026DB628E|nr:uncharacterized protein ONS95_001339 [Cadophora gregata]KAK0101848.1 hypothetical protein ONS96_005825 [Cadophora gregata f. sp. sojae]KAK0129417.1 hypothetical protein ONS95_001339 [Cadophora gregata]